MELRQYNDIRWMMGLLFYLLPSGLFAQATGFVFDEDAYYQTPLKIGSNFARSNLDTVRFRSLKQFCPVPGNQGNIGSCTSWSVAYGALTIMDAAMYGLTNKAQITQQAFAPLFVHNQVVHDRVMVSESKDPCGETGISFESAVSILKDSGVCLRTSFNPPDCRVLPEIPPRMEARNNRQRLSIVAVERLSGKDEDGQVDKEYSIKRIRSCILENKPVLFAMQVTNSFMRLNSRQWSPLLNEEREGLHAMLITGYDDANREFEVLNSWNNGYWGDPANRGFCYIGYEDLLDPYYFQCAYTFTVAPPVKPKDTVVFDGAFDFQRLTWLNNAGEAQQEPADSIRYFDYSLGDYRYAYYTFTGDPVLNQDGSSYLSASDDLHTGDYFRLVIRDVTKYTFVYLLSIRPDSTVSMLLPKLQNPDDSASMQNILPIIPSEETQFVFPGTEGEAMVATQAGDDRLIVLYSRRELSKEKLLALYRQFGDNPELSSEDNLRAVLDNALVPAQDIRYEPNRMAFRVSTTSDGYVVPLVMKLNIK